MKQIDLMDASPALAELKDVAIPVPGTYDPNSNLIYVHGMGEVIPIIESKQRPRRLFVRGSDGIEYSFLLKAHEDTRLDERVMQLFSFINTFVDAKMAIETYRVIPITGEVGLIGWVQDCNTLFDLIRQHREKKGIGLELEFQYVMSKFPNYDVLGIPEKIRAFEEGLKKASGTDLKAIMLNNSADSAHWLDRRSNFTASLAMTSMAGYLLGLGDRHMMNIMMKTKTAKLVHIDFGDCFEVAQNREAFPEKVPFRLSRQLINALEVAGINGTFRSSCQMIASLLRQNIDQIIGLLSVFTYDPLKQWSSGAVMGSSEQSPEAVRFMGRIIDKLQGNDFEGRMNLTVEMQVDLLIEQATAGRNLCQMFKGWYAWW
jgi:FKBP12-rapamycin complex-associated protein